MPWPGTFTEWNGRTLKIVSGSPVEGTAAPGQVVRYDGRIAVGTGQGLYVLDRVQLAGKPAVDVQAFVNGHTDFIGSTLS